MISEVLISMKLIKMYAWEKSFAEVIYGKLCFVVDNVSLMKKKNFK